MSKSTKSVTDMLDYVRQLRRHTEGRRAIHVRLSALEKYFREEHYRRFVASALRPLITKFGATMFALPNADIVLMVKDASVDTIDPLLNNIRRKYRDSELISNIDAVQGVSDAFVEWFDLETDYQSFLDYVQELADELLSGTPKKNKKDESAPERKRTPGMLELNARPPEPMQPSSKMKMVVMETEPTAPEKRQFDVDLLHSMTNVLQAADVTSMLRKQRVMAILGSQAAQPVMIHRFVPMDTVFEVLLQTEVEVADRWLQGYLEDFLAARLLASTPSMQNEQSIASSLRVTCDGVCSPVFDQFDQSLGDQQRSAVIIEFSAKDLMANFTAYQRAHEKLDAQGYRVSVGDIDPRTLPWLDYVNLSADFVKLRNPTVQGWLTAEMETDLKARIQKIGFARIILDGCERQADIDQGQRLGITLFQGAAVEPMSAL